jgi:hypothetical protein
MQINLENPSSKVDLILSSIQIEELNIYNQAYLNLETPMIRTNVLHEGTKSEKYVSFPINGDFNGVVVSFLDTFGKEIDAQNNKLLDNLFVESMNILLGRLFTKIEKISDLNFLLGSPNTKTRISLSSLKKGSNSLTYSIGYKLLFNTEEFNCRVVFILNKNKIIEV